MCPVISTIAPGAKVVVRAVGSVAELPRMAWDSLDHGPSPFLKSGFLAALEGSGSIDPATAKGMEAKRGKGRRGHSGWTSVYILAEVNGQLAGGVAAFVKSHSYGEYIFDWGWANAAARAGIEYYPKLVIAAPHTPATGPRMLLAKDLGAAADDIRAALVAGVRAVADDTNCSSIHWLFCTPEEHALLATHDFFGRTTHQFHWKNRAYKTFDDFLGELTSRKRKQLRKERARAKAAIEALHWRAGRDMDEAALDDLDRFYRNTTDNHGGRDYLRPGFFHLLAKELPDAMQMVEVIIGGKRVAGALFLESEQALYGRYWGADVSVDLLHFETAYYAGIDRAIERGYPLFEAGAQGEHKLLRGFEPSPTFSAHWIRHPGLGDAIADFCRREAAEMEVQLPEMAKLGPYRQADAPDEEPADK